jgi:hypothetical protein
MKNKPKLFFDMDNTLVNTLPVLDSALAEIGKFNVEKPDQIPGIFRNLKPLPQAIESVQKLSKYFDTYILSTAPWNNPSSWTDKIEWINEYFGNDENSPFYKKVVMTHQKGVARANGGILIDDRPYHGASEWDDSKNGTYWLQYGFDSHLVWNDKLVEFLIEVSEKITAENLSERDAVLEVNKKYNYQLQGPHDNFEKSSWE